MQHTIAVAIVGAGPAGYYVADGLFRSGIALRLDLFERLPVPYGLVRYGVAPDRPNIKRVGKHFDRIAKNVGFRFFGNVTIGKDLTVKDLCRAYDAVVFSCGMPNSRSLHIPGESLHSSYSASEFVGWYNGHPEQSQLQPDLSTDTAVVIGNGDVALDVARILARPADEFSSTDMPSEVQSSLSKKCVRTIWVVGRRGPAQSSFSAQELNQLQSNPSIACTTDPRDFALTRDCHLALTKDSSRKAAVDILKEMPATESFQVDHRVQVRFRFLMSPERIEGTDNVRSIQFRRNRLVREPDRQGIQPTAGIASIPCGLVVRCIGYRGVPIPDVPFDATLGIFSNQNGRISNGMYAAGWIQRGPKGLLGTTKKLCRGTISAILEDTGQRKKPPVCHPDELIQKLISKGVRFTDLEAWRCIDSKELTRGKQLGKQREKFVTLADLLDAGGASYDCPNSI